MHVSTCKGCQVKHGRSAICTEAYPLEKSKIRQNATYKTRTCLLRVKLSCFRNSAIFCDVTGFLVLLRRSKYYSGRFTRDYVSKIRRISNASTHKTCTITCLILSASCPRELMHVVLSRTCTEISNVRLFERLNARAWRIIRTRFSFVFFFFFLSTNWIIGRKFEWESDVRTAYQFPSNLFQLNKKSI